MVNGSGYFLQGWPSDATGNPDRTSLAPIRVSQQLFNPIATTEIDLNGSLPANPAATPLTTQAKVYDALGGQHSVNLTFTPGAANSWTLGVSVPDDISAATRGTLDLQFGAAATPAAPPGAIGSFSAATGSIATPAAVAGAPAAFTFTADFGQGVQTVSLNLGEFGSSQGLTQFNGTSTTFDLGNLTQNGVPLGAYSGIGIRGNGDVSVNYDNGQSRVVGRVPLVAFADPEKLQRLDGQAFIRTVESGDARITDAASNGVGKLVIGSIERSNVDIAAEFTKLIVAQRAYTANTRVVTTSDEMLQDTLNLKR